MYHESIELAVEALSNNMRLHAEAEYNFIENFLIDREEAINNVDRTFESLVESFHTVYDVSKNIIDYFLHADTSLIISTRNAIHHRNNPLFRSLYHEIFLRSNPKQWVGAEFLLASYQTDIVFSERYFRLDDFRCRLDPDAKSTHLDTHKKYQVAHKRFELIKKALSFDKIYDKARKERYPTQQIYINIMPIFASAVSRVFRKMQALGMSFDRFDAITYMAHFEGIDVDLKNVYFKQKRII